MDKNLSININAGTFVKMALIALGAYFLYMIRDIFAVVLLSVVIASGVEIWSNWLQKIRIPRVLSVLLIYLLVFSLLGIVFYMLIPPIFSELSELSRSASSYAVTNSFEVKTLAVKMFSGLPLSLSVILQNIAESAQKFAATATGGFFNAGANMFGGALSLVLLIVFSFYLSVQEKGIENFLRVVIPAQHEKYVIDLWKRSSEKIGAWLKGQVLLGMMVGIFVFLGLTFLQVKYAIMLAILAAMFELIPIFGPILAAIPSVAFAFMQSPSLALAVIALYFVIQQFENQLIYPLVIRKITGVPPILVILAIVIGGKLGGFFGILLSIPAITVLMEFLNDIEKKKLSA